MSIANIPGLPYLQVQNIKFSNPALASSSLSTDANGNVIAGGGAASQSSQVSITGNPGVVINLTSNTSYCEFVVNGNIVFVNVLINFQLNSIPAQGEQTYVFGLSSTAPIPLTNFTGTNVQIARPNQFYNSIFAQSPDYNVPIFQDPPVIELLNGYPSFNGLALNFVADLSTLSENTTYSIVLSGWYFSQ